MNSVVIIFTFSLVSQTNTTNCIQFMFQILFNIIFNKRFGFFFFFCIYIEEMFWFTFVMKYYLMKYKIPQLYLPLNGLLDKTIINISCD